MHENIPSRGENMWASEKKYSSKICIKTFPAGEKNINWKKSSKKYSLKNIPQKNSPRNIALKHSQPGSRQSQLWILPLVLGINYSSCCRSKYRFSFFFIFINFLWFCIDLFYLHLHQLFMVLHRSFLSLSSSTF